MLINAHKMESFVEFFENIELGLFFGCGVYSSSSSSFKWEEKMYIKSFKYDSVMVTFSRCHSKQPWNLQWLHTLTLTQKLDKQRMQ